jgi:hypothetical protein
VLSPPLGPGNRRIAFAVRACDAARVLFAITIFPLADEGELGFALVLLVLIAVLSGIRLVLSIAERGSEPPSA